MIIKYRWVKLAGFGIVEKKIIAAELAEYLEWQKQGRITIL